MGFVLGLAALRGRAVIEAFTDKPLADTQVRAFSDRVEMVLDPEVNAAYPERWVGPADAQTSGGERFTSRLDVPKGDPGNTPSREEEVEEKARGLAASREAAGRLTERARNLHRAPDLRDLLLHPRA